MNTTHRILSLTLVCLSFTSCCALPEWIGGNRREDVTIPQTKTNADKYDTYTLCANSEAGTDGIVALKKKEYQEAIEHFKKAVNASDSKDPNALFNYGLALEMDSEYGAAVECFNKAIDANPKEVYIESYKRAKLKRDS